MPEFEDFYFDSTVRGQRIHAVCCKPEGKVRAVVQIAHGIAEHIDRYRDFMAFLAENGFLVVGNDHLGHGKTAADEKDRGAFCPENGWSCVVGDMVRLHDRTAVRYPNVPYVMFGHSMGSFLTRTYLIDHPDKYHMAILCGTGNMPRITVLAGYLAAKWTVRRKGYDSDGSRLKDLAMGSYQKRIPNPRTDCDWLSRDPKTVDAYINDPACNFTAKAGLYRDMVGGVAYVTNRRNIARMDIDKPIRFISGSEDPVGEWGKGVKRAYERFRRTGVKDLTIRLFEGDRHEILNETDRQEVYQDVLNWLNEHI